MEPKKVLRNYQIRPFFLKYCVGDPVSYLGHDEFSDTIDNVIYDEKTNANVSTNNLTLKNVKGDRRNCVKLENKLYSNEITEELVFNEEFIQKIYK